MTDRTERVHGEGGASARSLVLIFLACVAVCAVFFSLGFVVGYNQQTMKTSPVTENVTPPGNIPPTVNVPPANSNSSPSTKMPQNLTDGSGASLLQGTEHPQPLAQASAERMRRETQPAPKNPSQQINLQKPTDRVSSSAPSPSLPVPSVGPNKGSHFAVQVMASRTKADAITLIRLLESRGYHVFLVSPRAGSPLYKVQVGPYASRRQAESARNKLQKQGFKPFITH